MWKTWKGLQLFTDAPERAGGGAVDDTTADGDQSAIDRGGDGDGDGVDADDEAEIEILPDEDPTQARAAGADASDDDEDDEEEDDDVDESTLTPEAKRWRNRERRMRKQVSKLRRTAGPLVDTLRSLGQDGEDPVKTLTRLLQRAQQADTLEEAIAADERIAELLGHKRSSAKPSGRSTAPAPAGDDDDDFDESTLPFDPNADDVHRWLAAQARENHQLRKRLERFEQTDQERQRTARDREARQSYETELKTWESAAVDAAKALPEKIRVRGYVVNLRKTFLDNCYGAFRYAKAKGLTVSPDKVIKHYLTEAGIDEGKSERARAAAAERIARNNKKLPQHQAGGGPPAPAKNARETLSDVLKRRLGVQLHR